jgi:hypothetical protein
MSTARRSAYNSAMRFLRTTVALLLFSPAVLACDFEFSPAAIPQFYRAQGWILPGTTDFNPRATPRSYGAPVRGEVPGAKARLLSHDEDPYIIEFPAQEFILDGARNRMHSIQVKATIVRWDVGDRVVAYSYGLIPVVAHRKNGKWVVTSELGCIFDATFLDDKGDGIFRVLVRGVLTPDLVPLWAKRNEN